MKLLFVHQHLGAFGGAETNIHLTASELRRRGHTVGLLYRRGTGRTEEAWRETFTPCVCLASQDLAKNVETAIDQLDQFAPDLIYFHILDDMPLLAALLQSGVPVVRMVHDHAMYCLRGYKYNWFTRRICTRPASLHCVFPCLASIARSRDRRLGIKWASYAAKREEIRLNSQCQRLVVYSDYSRQELIRNGFDPQKIEIHSPVQCRGAGGPVSSLSDRNLILYVGQIIRGKGVDLLLRALAKVKVPFEALILGEGQHRPYCERLCRKLGLNSHVQFRGYVPHDELENSYLAASLFVVSSVWPEPFGMVGPEAMRYGLPVVAFDAGGIREWLIDGQNGYLAPWMDTNRFAFRVEELLLNKELARQMGRRGLERVNRVYEASRQIDALEEMFVRVLRQTPDSCHENSSPSLFPAL